MMDIVWKCLAAGCVAGLGVLLVQYFWEQLKRNLKKGLPPGPYGLPFVGYLPFMPKNGHRGVEALKDKYGPVFGVTLGSRYVVFLCDFTCIKEALSQDSLLNRPVEFPFMVHKESQGLAVLNGPLWKEQRRFSLRLFKKLGIATQAMERHIHDEVGHLLQEFRDKKNQPVCPATLLTPSTSNIISALMFGRRFEYSDPDRIYLDKLIEIVPALAAQTTFINFFPCLRNLMVFLKLGACERLRDALARREDFVESEIDFHHERCQDGVVRDYIDGFIFEMRNQEGDQKTFTRNLLKGNVASFFGAGSETVRAAIDWLLLMSAVYPERQKKIQAEIDEVVGGTDRQVAWSDRNKMPYTQAFMWEVMRCKPVNPLNLMRYASKDVAVGRFVIPEGSIVIASFWSVFYDADFWGDPECFRPERFLVDGGTRAVRPDCFIPFSYGKRSCPGEVIANLEVFIYFTTLLQHFNVEPPPNGPKLVFDEVLGLSLRAKPQELVFRQR
ncbi:cytochrome P450 2J6-like [Ixodes scapularis]|uniref:cytochrome P450 2J6-like n=1 Tax=Ixodes scapularis TaxID=6945 RepID=UPI001A9CCF5C|nr:cytochrome P450 2J6-like [Ixodes scapularis]